MIIKETIEQRSLKQDLKEMFKEVGSHYKAAVKEMKAGKLDPAELDKIVKMVSTLKSLRETGYAMHDILTQKEKCDLKMKTKELELKVQVAEINAEIALLRGERAVGYNEE